VSCGRKRKGGDSDDDSVLRRVARRPCGRRGALRDDYACFRAGSRDEEVPLRRGTVASLNGKPNRKRSGHLMKRDGGGTVFIVPAREKAELARLNASAPALLHDVVEEGEDGPVRFARFTARPRVLRPSS